MESSKITSSIALSAPDLEQSSEGNGQKLHRSEEEARDIKEQQTSPGKNSPNTREDAQATDMVLSHETSKSTSEASKTTNPSDTKEARRKSSLITEKQRNKRLFSSLLGNLNQPGDRASKRRAEIEQRRKAELQKQDEERLEDRQRRLDQLLEHRRKAQEKLDEENMYCRHTDMLDKANFLQTTTEPRLFYRPWELLPSQEDIIEDQIRDTKVKIDQELAVCEENKRQKDRAREEDQTREPILGKDDMGNDMTVTTVPTDTMLTIMQDGRIAVTANMSEIRPDGEVAHSSADDTGESSNVLDANQQVSDNITINIADTSKAEPIVPGSSDKLIEDENTNKKKDDDLDDEGDQVVEGDEDNVIY